MTFPSRLGLFLLPAVLTASPVPAQTPPDPARSPTGDAAKPMVAVDTVYREADPDLLLDLAKGYGSASLTKDSSGDPMIQGRIKGVKYAVYFYGCKQAAHCTSLQFATGFTDAFSAEKANEWNSKYRWIKANTSNGSNFKMDCDLYGGVTKDWLDSQFQTWETLIGDIRDFVQ